MLFELRLPSSIVYLLITSKSGIDRTKKKLNSKYQGQKNPGCFMLKDTMLQAIPVHILLKCETGHAVAQLHYHVV